jgi:cytochrome P450
MSPNPDKPQASVSKFGTMTKTIPTVSVADSLAFNLCHIVPYYLRGIFTKNKFWISFWNKVHRDPLAVNFIRRLRQKYNSDYFYIYLLRNKSLVVLDLDGIERVLDNSPAPYAADPDLKRRGMSHFQPNALTISRGAEWRERRQFNETVLASSQRVHPQADQFLRAIDQATELLTANAGQYLVWDHFDHLFKRITLEIIFGHEARDDTALANRLTTMMRESNRVFLLGKSKEFDLFYERIRHYLECSETGSLASMCKHAPSTVQTKVENQIPHWMFAMMETLATNTMRALALIVSHPNVEDGVRQEIQEHGAQTPKGVDSLTYLEGCIQEAMRLSPTTPMLTRQTVQDDVLGGNTIPSGTQIVILNGFNHRDWETDPDIGNFRPEFWLDKPVDYQFNHLSNGTQVCAGKNLALFIAKAVIASLLVRGRYRLHKPKLNSGKPLPFQYDDFATRFEYFRPFQAP